MGSHSSFPEHVSADTQAVLLLCGTFAQKKEEAKPLTNKEYHDLATWLEGQRRRPAGLLQSPDEPFPAGEVGLPPVERVRALLSRGAQMAVALERWQGLGLWVVSLGEMAYPERLRRTQRVAPPLLFGAGDISRLNRGGLAIVGSRDPGEEAMEWTRQVASRCAEAGVQVISGGARRIDQTAVTAVLDPGGGAVAVLADRLDRAATSRSFKEPIRRGQLTLVTPYMPELSFSVGTAMGRNKYIYALADSALVARFTQGEGGTWAGAVEQLRANKSGKGVIPVFVRVAHNPEDGWQELQKQGALAFPEAEFWRGNPLEVLRQGIPKPEPVTVAPVINQDGKNLTGTELPVPRSPGPPSLECQALPTPGPAAVDPATGPQADTCYNRCLPLLLQSLHQKPSKEQLPQVAKELGLHPKQLKDWLARAVEEGKVVEKKKGKKVVYAEASGEKVPTLFDRDGDAA